MDLLNSNELTYVITIYAVLPTIVIVLLFNLLTDLDRQVSTYEGMLLDNKVDCINNVADDHDSLEVRENLIKQVRDNLRSVDKFIIVSSRYLHMTMSFYLIYLVSSFLYELLHFNKLILLYSSITVYLIYFTLYTFAEMRTIEELKLRKKYLYYGLYTFALAVLPFALVVYLCLVTSWQVQSFFIAWITANVIQIGIWWLVFPVHDKPLNKLNKVSKNILQLTKGD